MELLERLINAHGVSGNEGAIREVIRKEITPLVDEIWTDSSGNLIAREKGKRPRFMLSAHMDEIGLMVREITSRGLLLCAAVGGVNPVAMIGTRVTVEGAKETVHGLITTREVSCGYDVEELPGIDELVVDTGLSKEDLLGRGVTVGSFLEPDKKSNWLLHGHNISGKALDNRLGCWVLIEAARQLKGTEYDTYFTFTVQEEVGLYGAKTGAFAIRPRWAFVVDVTPAVDLAEDAESKGTSISLGKGPCLLHMDESFIADARLNRVLMDVAEKCGVNLQHEVSSFGTTDATNISTVRRGVPSASVSIPVRNVHSTVEIADRRDVDAVVKLLVALLRNPPAELRRGRLRGRRAAARAAKSQVKAGAAKAKAKAGKPKAKKSKKEKKLKTKKERGAGGKLTAKKKKKKTKKKAGKKKRKSGAGRSKKARKKPQRRRKSRRTVSGRPKKRVRPKPKRKRTGRKARVRKH